MRYEPTPRGLPIAREAIAAYYRERSLHLDPNHLHLTASTSEAYSWLFKLLADAGDNVLVPQPSYPLFEFLATLEGVRLKPYTLDYIHPRGWRIDLDSLTQVLDARTRAILLVSPNNPTGSFIKHNELQQLNALCAERGLALIVDEVFSDYRLREDAAGVDSLLGNADALTFVMSGLSKVLALPQMKLGWIGTSGPSPVRDQARERLDLIADTFLSVGAPVQHAAATWLALRTEIQTQISARTRNNLRQLVALVEGSSCRVLDVEGGWYATLEVPRVMPEEELVVSLLREREVLVHPGYFFDFSREAFLILSLLPPPDLFAEGVRRVLEHLGEHPAAHPEAHLS